MLTSAAAQCRREGRRLRRDNLPDKLSLTVLLVEDEPLIAMTLVDMLEELGHRAVEATSGKQALDRFSDGIDVLITDIGLPDVKGDELARRLRERSPGLPVLFATGHLPPDVDGDSAPTGAIGKPFNIDDLKAALSDLLRER